MPPEIKAIFLDLGNTLRFVVKDELHMARARQEIIRLLGSEDDPDSFCKKLNTRYKDYRKWAFDNLAEATEAELWTRWLAPEFPAEKISSISKELTYQFRQTNGRRVVVEDGKEVIVELHMRGYKLGIISNLISTKEIPEWLEEDGYEPYFSSVVLSSVYGKRKPDPAIYLEAAKQAGVAPENCVYVGDNLNRDVTGTREAGFGLAVIIISPEDLAESTINEHNRPDIIINKFSQLLEIFNERSFSIM